MNKILLILLITLTTLSANANEVKGYYRKDGTYVKAHHKTKRDGNVYNNYSTKGNHNPHTGKLGKIDPSSIDKEKTVSN